MSKSIFSVNEVEKVLHGDVRKTSILIIEDDPISCKLLESTLKKEGYQIYSVQTGNDGLQKANEIIPDIILLDIVLPDINGFEICRKIRDDKNLSEVAIIIITSLHDKESHRKGIEAGADDFLTKPFDNEELKLRVKAIAKLNRFRKILSERTKFEWVVEKSEYGYVIIDKNDEIVYINPQAKLFLNLPQQIDKPINKKFKELVLEQYNLEPKNLWENWFGSNNVGVNRYFVRPESSLGGAFWLQVECLELPRSLSSEKIISMKDVTNQKYSQARMRTFQSMVYHKLRTPMTSVLGGMEILSQYNKIDLSDKDIKDYFEEVYNGLQRLYSSIEDIFVYQEAVTFLSYDDVFNTNSFDSLLKSVSQYVSVENYTLINKIKNNVLLLISEKALEFIMIELFENSKKFHPNNNPQIIVEIEIFQNNCLIIRVIDDGKNIPPENLNKVWAPYFQVEKIFTGNISGMGLGLSSIATIVWNIGGSCNIQNRQDGSGVIVELLLPINK